jgi:hypothetical protein
MGAALGNRLLRLLFLLAGAFAGFLLWNLLTTDAAAAATPGPVDVDLDIGAPTPGASLPEALPPITVGSQIDPTAIPPLADAPVRPIEIEVDTAPPRIELPDLLPPLGAEPPPVLTPPLEITELDAPAPRRTPQSRHLDESRPTVSNHSTNHAPLAQPLSPPVDDPSTPRPASTPTSDSDGIPVPPLPLLAVLGAVIALAASTSRDWSWLTRAPRSTLLAPALERPG